MNAVVRARPQAPVELKLKVPAREAAHIDIVDLDKGERQLVKAGNAERRR